MMNGGCRRNWDNGRRHEFLYFMGTRRFMSPNLGEVYSAFVEIRAKSVIF